MCRTITNLLLVRYRYSIDIVDLNYYLKKIKQNKISVTVTVLKNIQMVHRIPVLWNIILKYIQLKIDILNYPCYCYSTSCKYQI